MSSRLVRGLTSACFWFGIVLVFVIGDFYSGRRVIAQNLPKASTNIDHCEQLYLRSEGYLNQAEQAGSGTDNSLHLYARATAYGVAYQNCLSHFKK